jgi:hypothetical protein
MLSNIQDGAKHFLSAFSDPKAVARYSEGPRRSVPGFGSTPSHDGYPTGGARTERCGGTRAWRGSIAHA